MKLIDLHTHSNCSDGTLSPSELVAYAKTKELAAIALTDHDTTVGLKECMEKGLEVGVTVIPGIELSGDHYGKELHILGYYIDPSCPALQTKLQQLVESRKVRNLKMLDKLEALGFPLTLDDLNPDGQTNVVFTRAHFGTAMLKKGYVKDRQEAFTQYLGNGKPAYVAREHFTVQECINLIHEAGGLAVLAHPKLYGYSSKDITELLIGLKAQGIDGIECLYSTHTPQDVAHLLQLCLNHKLFPTGGSDFHGSNKPNLDLGTGYGKLQIPLSLLDAMHKRLGIEC